MHGVKGECLGLFPLTTFCLLHSLFEMLFLLWGIREEEMNQLQYHGFWLVLHSVFGIYHFQKSGE